MARDSIVHSEDSANQLDFKHLARVVHFHLKNYFIPKNKIIQDLSKKAFNQMDLTFLSMLIMLTLLFPSICLQPLQLSKEENSFMI
jgi:hypothetical protein